MQFYRVPTFESAGGRSLAELIAARLSCFDDLAPEIAGMRLPMLRETRMPAVHCVFGPVRVALEHGTAIAGAIIEAVEQWVSRSS